MTRLPIARIIIVLMLVLAAAAGIALYYLQVYAYYDPVPEPGAEGITLVSRETGLPEPIAFSNFTGIDSDTSPIRYRSCFDTGTTPAALAETYETYPAAEPLNAPGWFDCFTANALGSALENGEATAFLGERDVLWGVDRIIAVLPDGRALGWNQINPCGAVVFAGDALPEDCPPLPDTAANP